MRVLTGTKSTDMISSVEDIRIIIEGSRARIGGLTMKGLDWLFKNMYAKYNQPITVEKEYLDEIKELIKNDGLTVKEKE